MEVRCAPPAEGPARTTPELDALKVAELKTMCKDAGLKQSGTKAELVRRLAYFYNPEDVAPPPEMIGPEMLARLNDERDELAAQLAELQAASETRGTDIAKLKEERDDLLSQVEVLRAEIGAAPAAEEMMEALETRDAALAASEALTEELKAALEEAEQCRATVTEERDVLKEVIADAAGHAQVGEDVSAKELQESLDAARQAAEERASVLEEELRQLQVEYSEAESRARSVEAKAREVTEQTQAAIEAIQADAEEIRKQMEEENQIAVDAAVKAFTQEVADLRREVDEHRLQQGLQSSSSTLEGAASRLRAVSVVWMNGGEEVEVHGSFDGWTSAFPLQPTGANGAPAGFATTLFLYPGTYEMKFVMDGEWVVDVTKPMTVPPEGSTNVNNLLVVPEVEEDASEEEAVAEAVPVPEAAPEPTPAAAPEGLGTAAPPQVPLETPPAEEQV